MTKYIKYLVLALLIYMPVFGFLDSLPIRIWDESRIAVSAMEMFHNGDFIVTYFEYSPDMWNTKPPLLIWCQVFFLKTIGFNEIAIRLPTALAVFFTCLSLLIFSLRYLKNFWFGFITILLLITSDGYINTHIARTGDYDALLTLFTTLSGLLFFAYCETKKTGFLYLFFTAVLLAVLTKGVAGLLFFPALLLYAIIQKHFLFFFKNKHFYIGLLSCTVLIISYYLLREYRNPGYIAIVQENELGGRYLVSQGNQDFDFWFYLNNLIGYRLPDRYLLIPCGLVFGFVSKDLKIRKFTLFVTLMIVTYFLIISIGKTKLAWYDAPLYPLLSLSIALFIHFIFDLLKNSKQINQFQKRNVLPFLFLFLIFIFPYKNTWAKTYQPDEAPWDAENYEIGYYLRNAVKGKHDLNGKYLAYDTYHVHNLFYIRILLDQGVNTGCKDFKQLNKDDVVIVCQNHVKQYIEQHYQFKSEQVQGPVSTYSIFGKIEDTIPSAMPRVFLENQTEGITK